MNALSRPFVAVAAFTIFAVAGTACATTPDTTNTVPDTTPMPSSAAIPPSTGTPSTGTPSGSTNGTPSSSSSAPSSSSTSSAADNANAHDAEARKIFDQLDTNHDGILTLDEFSRATIRAK
jgi:hypothetical protein